MTIKDSEIENLSPYELIALLLADAAVRLELKMPSEKECRKVQILIAKRMDTQSRLAAFNKKSKKQK